jgi:Cu/Ag efflux pump CusA
MRQLAIVVPFALLLILFLLYAALGTMRSSLLVLPVLYAAIERRAQ